MCAFLPYRVPSGKGRSGSNCRFAPPLVDDSELRSAGAPRGSTECAQSGRLVAFARGPLSVSFLAFTAHMFGRCSPEQTLVLQRQQDFLSVGPGCPVELMRRTRCNPVPLAHPLLRKSRSIAAWTQRGCQSVATKRSAGISINHREPTLGLQIGRRPTGRGTEHCRSVMRSFPASSFIETQEKCINTKGSAAVALPTHWRSRETPALSSAVR